MTLTISPARLRDLNALRKMEKVVFSEDAWPVIDLMAALFVPGGIHYKAEIDGNIVGFISAENNLFENVTWVTTVGVIPEYRNQGVGCSLMKAVEDVVTRPMIKLCVRKSNSGAIHLYEKLGYHTQNTRRKYYSDGEDAFVMAKTKPVMVVPPPDL